MKAVQGAGRRVPDDIAVIGFSDGLMLKYVTPSITTVSQHGEDMGREAAEMLIDRINSDSNEESFSTKVIKTTLIERESSL